MIFADPDPFVGFVLVPDLKWDGKEVENMYVLAIARRRGLLSLRDVTSVSEHVPLLKHIILEEGKVRLIQLTSFNQNPVNWKFQEVNNYYGT